METRDKCKVTNFIINLNIQHEQVSNKSSSLIKQSILSLLRTLIFQILSEKKVKKVIFPSRTSVPLYIAIAKNVMTYWASRLCHSCVHNSESLWLSQNLPVGMCCLSFLCKPRNWYGNCFISIPPTWNWHVISCCNIHIIYVFISFLPLHVWVWNSSSLCISYHRH